MKGEKELRIHCHIIRNIAVRPRSGYNLPEPMNHDLLISGQNAGSFPLETLRERKRAGELTGMELVRRADSSEWMTLDSALRDAERAGGFPPLPPMPSSAAVPVKSSDCLMGPSRLNRASRDTVSSLF